MENYESPLVEIAGGSGSNSNPQVVFPLVNAAIFPEGVVAWAIVIGATSVVWENTVKVNRA